MNQRKILIIAMIGFLIMACLCSPLAYYEKMPTLQLPSVPTNIIIETSSTLSPNSGASGLEDPYYPLLGNGGYDVQKYLINLNVDPLRGEINGYTELSIITTQELTSFNLDFSGLDVIQVTLNDNPIQFTRYGSELILYPSQPLTPDISCVVRVSYKGIPTAISDPSLSMLPIGGGIGWMEYPSGIYTINEPSGSMSWFPSNNYPTDKATYEYRITVNKPSMVAASGLLQDVIDNGDTRTFVWKETYPMSSYLASVDIGKFDMIESTGPHGLPMRSFYSIDLSPEDIKPFDALVDMIALYESLIAPYPFEAYGVVVIPESVGVAMENQTLSLFGRDMAFEEAIAHELAHQWFGDSVTISNWPDIWLNEGFATYMEALWIEHKDGQSAFDQYMDQMYQDAKSMSAPEDPGISGLFGWSVYERGAWVLHALRLTLGDEIFFEILRTYYQRYQYSNASTEDFIAVAAEVSGRDLTDFFDAWLYSESVPPLP